MTDLFSLLHDLAERMANKSESSTSSTQQQDDEDDPVESRFRAVLPNLLETYFLPERVQEREILAILKLLRHTVEHYPGVLFHGKPQSVLPIVARIVPLFAEPLASACRDYLFDMLCSLLRLLCTKAPEIFCKFVTEATLLFEDLVAVGSFYSSPATVRGTTSLSVHCFREAFSVLFTDGVNLFCRLPTSWDAKNGGIIVDVTERMRWEPLGVYMVKLLNHCLLNHSLIVRARFTPSFLSSVGNILCYGTSHLHKACFDFVCNVARNSDPDAVPCEKFIMSILTIFSLSNDAVSRDPDYDCTLGACLVSLYAISQKNVVNRTVGAFMDIFPSTVRSTSCRELKVALCNVMSVILNQCPSYGGSVLSLTALMFIPDIVSPFSFCIQLALDIQMGSVTTGNYAADTLEGHVSKRRKLNIEKPIQDQEGFLLRKSQVDNSQALWKAIRMLEGTQMPLDNLLAGYYVLISVLRRDGDDIYRAEVMKHLCSLLNLLRGEEAISKFQLSTLLVFFEVVDKLLVTGDMDLVPSESKSVVSEILISPWCKFNQVDNILRAKLQVISVASRLTEPEFEVDMILELGLKDEDVLVKSAAVASVPGLLSPASLNRLTNICQMLRGLEEDEEQVREALAGVFGPIFCIYAAKRSLAPVSFRSPENRRDIICNVCDKKNGHSIQPFSGRSTWSFVEHWQPVMQKLLFDETSCQVQVAAIRNLVRFSSHSSEQELSRMKNMWLKCLEVFPLHPERSIREAFASQIHFFIEESFWRCIFDSGDNGDFEVLGKFQHALVAAQDPEIVETLMETVAEIAKVARGDQLQVFSVVVLIEQLDNRDLAIRVTSLGLINEVAALRWPSDNGRRIDGLIDGFRKGLFEYLCGRLVTRPLIVREFAEAVLHIPLTDLLKQMIPVVLPKLVLEQQHDGNALETINVLARQMETTLPLFLLEWCHKVLAVLLLRADGKELMEALQFYEAQTRSDTREIFAAVLPALLHELVRFLGDVGSDEALKRSARVGPMIKEVASIVSESDDLSNFLKQHFVGLLNSLDRKLLRSEDKSCQQQALRCIERLLEMIGSHLSAFVPKIMALLSHAVQQEGLQRESFQVWFSFVKLLARVSPTSLKNVASQVVVALMPCLESDQASTVDGAARILEELVINCGNILDDQMRELPLLPSLSPLSSVNAVLREVRGSLNLREQLVRAADGLRHENLSLRYVTATELLKVLSNERKEVMVLILGEAPSDADAIGNLVTALLRGCAEESRTSMSQKFKLACAECLGGLGAIDPVKLQVRLRRRSRMEQKDEDFVFELINHHLAKVLRAASDTDVQDAAALAIQELLKLTGCSKGRSSTSKPGRGKKLKEPAVSELSNCGDRLWNRFSEDVKEIITPCLTSKYLLKNTGAQMPLGPIFRPGISFRRWMHLWVRRLISQVTGQRSSIFAACQGIIRHDMDTALYLLPYLILDLLHDDSVEVRSGVTEEILAVLQSETVSATNEAGSSKSGQPVLINNTFFGHGEVSIQAIFMLLDNLGQWVDDYKQGLALIQSLQSSRKAAAPSAQMKKEALQCDNVNQLLAAIPKKSLAGASLRCRANARALLYYESYVREKSGAFNPAANTSGVFEDEDIAFLLKIYGGLDEPDGLFGLAHLQTELCLQDQVLLNEKSGNWAEALTCCEQALQMEPKSLSWQSGVLNCLVNMGHFQAMATHVDGLIARMPDNKREWSIRGVQAAWRLGQWDLLDEYVQGAELETGTPYNAENDAVFDLGLAKILQALRSKEHRKFEEQLMRSRLALLAPLAAASMESYTRAYPVIVKLHMLRELEDFFTCSQSDNMLPSLAENWNGRLKMTQPSLWTREPILALRRMLFSSTSMQSEVETCWLQYAKLCRSSGHYESANRAILQVQACGAPHVHRERAKLLWDTKNSHQAIDELQQALAKVPVGVLGDASEAVFGGVLHKTRQLVGRQMGTSNAENVDTAKALLLLGRWAHETGQKQKEAVISIYARVREMQPKWEKGYFYMAKYYDDLLVDARKRQEENPQEPRGRKGNDNPWWNYLPDVMLYYARALHRSHHHLFQALPRLLTLWFEFGTTYKSPDKAFHSRVMGIMRGCLKDLPRYQWLAALPQLVSRICHNNDEVVRIVKSIISEVVKAYPQQALWTMAAVARSTVPQRQAAAAEIMQTAKNASNERDKHVFVQFANLIDQMIKLSFTPVTDKVRSLSLSTNEFGSLKRTMPLRVIMPIQRALTLNLPADGINDETYNPFPAGDCSTIEAIRDEVEVLVSLQRPKKVILVASDGTEHPFLCKPKDDLRKDARMMEFTAMINRLLSKDPSSRRRKLSMRTFSVIPLTEDCGMVEWVPHTRGMRHIIQDLYMACGKHDRKTNNVIKQWHDEKKIQGPELLEKVLPMFPPVFHKWFLNTFPEPTAWFQARLAYAHSAAVWSMVGHIVGLGDRHGENILLDSTTGDCVHVDFSCLFDKGLLLEKPELVPFRLTQNMVDGLGITGYEGVFLRTCEITLSVLRSNRETLMSVLETFIHDPLVEWTKSHKRSSTEVQNPHAQRALGNIEARLQGVVVGVGAAPSLPLSVEGQAHRLIAEAVCHENLGRMFIWWMAWY